MRRAPSIGMAGEVQGVPPRAKAASFTIDQCGRETDAKGLIVKNIAGRFEQLPSMECGKARDVDPL